MIRDLLPIRGRVTATLYDAEGRVKTEQTDDNLVVTAGLEWIAIRILPNPALDPASHIGVGTSLTPAAMNQTTLVSPLGARRALLTSARLNNAVTYTTTFPPAVSTGAITEYGLFNDVTGGTMIARAVKPVINKEDGDSLAVVWTLTIGD